MEIATLVAVLDRPERAAEHLQSWGLADAALGGRTLLELAESGLTFDLLASLGGQLGQHLPKLADPDAALAAFRSFLFASRSPLALAALCQRDAAALPMLLRAFDLGPAWANYLIDDPEAFDLLRQSAGQPLDRERLVAELSSEVALLADEPAIAAALGQARRRHLLRIAYGECVLAQRYELVAGQLTILAEAIAEAALQAAERKAVGARSLPRRVNPDQFRRAVIALGRLGGSEADYGPELMLLLVYDAAAEDTATFRAVADHFERVARLLVQLLSAAEPGPALRVELIQLPDSGVAAKAHSAEDVAMGLTSFGRTWHRQALLQVRPIAGDRQLGEELLGRLEAWLFRRYLSRADETGIKALKRRIVQEATLHQDDWRDVRLARGGLRDIEQTVGFLQLLVGGDQPAARQRGTLAAIAGLEQAGDVAVEERTVLETRYVALRRLEHRLQIAHGGNRSELPEDDCAVERIAAALGKPQPATEFRSALQAGHERTWQVLKKLLDSAFPHEPAIAREVELLLDPAPPDEEVRAGLAPFGFANPPAALATLQGLATETVPFLSTRRCRHFLAAILPQLLSAVAQTPTPDLTLDSLARVSDSLGGKGMLWELFHSHPPSLQLYVRLCAASPYLAGILTTNPGMIDELVDSLQLDRLPTLGELESTLAELSRGAGDPLAALYDFKNAQHLRIGVRDILGLEDIDRTHQALADVAETCLGRVAGVEYERLVEKYGVPTIGPGAFEGEPCRLVIVGLGKLGGREPNYHSELEMLFLYEAEGVTRPQSRSRRDQGTASNHFFTQLAQRIIKQFSQLTPKGRLYPSDAVLRPIGIGGAIAMSFADFQQHFAGGAAPLWHWQALCKARPVFGEAPARQRAANAIHELLASRTWRGEERVEIRAARLQLERGASERNLKRGPGGTLDVEILVQMLQLQHGSRASAVLVTNTQEALVALGEAGILGREVAERLGDGYRLLRRVESGLRLLNTSARHDLPAGERELAQLALLLGHSNSQRLAETCLAEMAAIRAIFDRLML